MESPNISGQQANSQTQNPFLRHLSSPHLTLQVLGIKPCGYPRCVGQKKNSSPRQMTVNRRQSHLLWAVSNGKTSSKKLPFTRKLCGSQSSPVFMRTLVSSVMPSPKFGHGTSIHLRKTYRESWASTANLPKLESPTNPWDGHAANTPGKEQGILEGSIFHLTCL